MSHITHSRSLISTIVVRYLYSMISLVSLSKISRLYVAEQAGLSLTWLQTLKYRFSLDGAHIAVHELDRYFQELEKKTHDYFGINLSEPLFSVGLLNCKMKWV